MWVPELPFQLRCGREPNLKERPLAFLQPEGGRIRSLWLVNRSAKAEGIRAGDPMDLALRQCPGLRVLEPEPQTWWEAQASLGDFLQHWSPQGQLLRLGEALLELRGMERLFGAPQDAAARLRRDLVQAHGWLSHGGLSRSATAAQVAARLEHEVEQVGEGAEASFLAPLPLQRLPELTPRHLFRFRRLGLRRVGDLQPIPLATLVQLLKEDEARKVLGQARGEDRPRLPLLADPPGSSRQAWRLDPPRLCEGIPLRRWCLELLWRERRSPRSLTLRWWDVDGTPHRWQAPPELLSEASLALAPAVEAAFRSLATRRVVIHRLELQLSWGLGQALGLFQTEESLRLHRLEHTLARLRRRYPERPVLPGWLRASPPP